MRGRHAPGGGRLTGPELHLDPALAAEALRHALARLTGFVAAAAALSTAVFSLASLFAGRRFKRAGAEALAPPEPLPALTILKPIKGTDQEMYENLASFLGQDYPRFQVLFCLQSSEDPALGVLRRLRQDFPAADMEIVISKGRIGYNPKVNNLSNAYAFAKHDNLMISDSDVRVEPDFLRRIVAPFRDGAVGMVTCFYRSAGASRAGSSLDALSVNAQFLPQALTAAYLCRMRFAMGAVMLVRRAAFEAAGGLLALSEHLADDFLLGRAVEAAGYRVEFSPIVVDSMADSGPLAEQFAHLVRWSRTIRVCNPAGYAGTAILYGTALTALHALLGGGWRAAALAGALVAWRAACVAWLHIAYLNNPGILRQLPWLPLSDLIQFAAWVAGLRSRRVLWRGESYSITAGGRLVPTRPKPDALEATAV